MRRHSLHVITAALTFTVGFLTAAKFYDLAFALPLALLVFVVASSCGKFRVPSYDGHRLKVAALTLVLWIPLFFIFLPLINPQRGFHDCTFNFGEAGAGNHGAADEAARVTAAEEPDDNNNTGITAYSCEEAGVYPAGANPIWAGLVDKKAVSKPAPFYPSDAKAARVEGTVAVSVLIDVTGKVSWAQAVSGHPRLRQSATEAACGARFHPALIYGPTVSVSGILTYNFVL